MGLAIVTLAFGTTALLGSTTVPPTVPAPNACANTGPAGKEIRTSSAIRWSIFSLRVPTIMFSYLSLKCYCDSITLVLPYGRSYVIENVARVTTLIARRQREKSLQQRRQGRTTTASRRVSLRVEYD